MDNILARGERERALVSKLGQGGQRTPDEGLRAWPLKSASDGTDVNEMSGSAKTSFAAGVDPSLYLDQRCWCRCRRQRR